MILYVSVVFPSQVDCNSVAMMVLFMKSLIRITGMLLTSVEQYLLTTPSLNVCNMESLPRYNNVI